MGKKRFISCCWLIEPTKETVKPNLTGEASFFGTLRPAVVLIELEPVPRLHSYFKKLFLLRQYSLRICYRKIA